MTRLSKNDWLTKGYEVLAVEGAAGLTIDNLTARLNVTKGSFYHHFQNAEDFKNALLEYWVEQYTTRIVQLSEIGGKPEEVFHRFLGILATEDPSVEITLRSWAAQDKEVRVFMQKIDKERVDQVHHWFKRMELDATLASHLSKMLYALLIGCYSMYPPIVGQELIQTISRFLITAGIIKETT